MQGSYEERFAYNFLSYRSVQAACSGVKEP